MNKNKRNDNLTSEASADRASVPIARRRDPRRRVRGAALLGVAIAACLSQTACSTLSDEDQIRFVTFKQNSKILYDDEQYQQAADQCRKGLLIDPKDLSLHQVLGYSLLRQGTPAQLLEAETVFRSCVSLEAEDPRNQLGLAEVLYQLGMMYEKTLVSFETDERLTADQRRTKTESASAQRDASFSECEEILTEFIRTPEGRENDTAHNTLARLYSNQGRYGEAADILRQLVARLQGSLNHRREQVDPESLSPEYRARYEKDLDRVARTVSSALHLSATIASKRDHQDEVVSAYAQIERLGQLDPADYFNRAMAYDKLGSRSAAIADFDTFTELAASLGIAFSETVHKAMRRAAELRAGKPTLRDQSAGAADRAKADPSKGAATGDASDKSHALTPRG